LTGGISEQIHLLGERSDIPRLSAALDIASSSSAYGEAFPMVIGEAMSCGVPCVVTDVGDSARIVDNTGYVVPPREPQALANAWQKMIELGSEGSPHEKISPPSMKVVTFKLEKHYWVEGLFSLGDWLKRCPRIFSAKLWNN
jgi:glycosyltransferase involved in cell wall biosynthesis